MTAQSYSRIAAVVFAVVALLQLSRALLGWDVSIAGLAVPLWASWIAVLVAGLLAWLGFTARRE